MKCSSIQGLCEGQVLAVASCPCTANFPVRVRVNDMRAATLSISYAQVELKGEMTTD